MNFVQKSNFLLSLFFTEIMSEKIIFRYFGEKTIICRPKYWSFNKGQKWILSKNRTFSYRCFSQKLCQKRSFLDILNRNNHFKIKKKEVLTRAKKWTFFKGVSPWILSKNRTFSYRRFYSNHIRKDRFWYCGKKRMILRGKKTFSIRG